eukprot:11486678-Heterocapsa_arctica.AAC.1
MAPKVGRVRSTVPAHRKSLNDPELVGTAKSSMRFHYQSFFERPLEQPAPLSLSNGKGDTATH